MKTSESIAKIVPALLATQREMGVVAKSATNPFYKSKYADINGFLEVAIPTLNKNGIVMLQTTSSAGPGTHFVNTVLMHESGEFLESGPLALELKAEDMQQLGSAITYARRYQLQALLSMEADDDDGNAASKKAPAKTVPNVGQSKPVTVLKAPEAPQAAPVAPVAATPVAKLVEAPKSPETSLNGATPPVKKPTFRKSTPPVVSSTGSDI